MSVKLVELHVYTGEWDNVRELDSLVMKPVSSPRNVQDLIDDLKEFTGRLEKIASEHGVDNIYFDLTVERK